MAKKPSFNITLTKKNIEESLIKMMESPDKERKLALKDFLSHLCKDSWQKEILVKIIMGASLKSDLQLNASYWVNYWNLPSWKIDKDLSVRKGLIRGNDYTKVTFIREDVYAENPLKVMHTFIDNTGVLKKEEISVSPEEIVRKSHNFPFQRIGKED